MSCASFLRSIGILSPREVTAEEISIASTENAARDNEEAFVKMRQAYKDGPLSHEKLRISIDKARMPFSDFEHFMKHGGRK